MLPVINSGSKRILSTHNHGDSCLTVADFLRSSEFSILGSAQIDKTAEDPENVTISPNLAGTSGQHGKFTVIFCQHPRPEFKVVAVSQRPRHYRLYHLAIIRMIIMNSSFYRRVAKRMATLVHVENIV